MELIAIIGIGIILFGLLRVARHETTEAPVMYVVPAPTHRKGGCFSGAMMFVLGVVLTLLFMGQIVIR